MGGAGGRLDQVQVRCPADRLRPLARPLAHSRIVMCHVTQAGVAQGALLPALPAPLPGRLGATGAGVGA